MKIRVLNFYQGKPSKERPILAGEYDKDDPRLYGIADYLLDNGFAVVVEPPKKESKG